jgi:DNA-binding PadR family transcriptional regulator
LVVDRKNRLKNLEYDAFNFLDDQVLGLIKDSDWMSDRKIIEAVKSELLVKEWTVYTCLFLLTVNGLVINRRIDTQVLYKITEEGRLFLEMYSKEKTKLLRLAQSRLPQSQLGTCTQ